MGEETTADQILDRIERECTRFLYREAELLDRRQFHEWLDLMSPDIDYRIPVRTTRDPRDGDGFSTTSFFMEEDHASLRLRVARLDSDYAWSETPPSRTRRVVANVRLASPSTSGVTGSEHAVTSNLTVFSFRGESPVPVVLTGERQDVLRREAAAWKLRRRLVLLDTTVLGMESLSIFL